MHTLNILINAYIFSPRKLVVQCLAEHICIVNTSVGKKKLTVGFPGGAVVGSLPANAGDTGSSPGLGGSRIPWSGWAHEPQLLSVRVWSLCSATGEAAMVRGPRTAMKSGPRSPQLERALAQRRKTQHSQKFKKN